MKKILIIGAINNPHICRLIKSIKQYDCDNLLLFDGFNTELYKNENNSLFNTSYQVKSYFHCFLYKIYIIRTICIYIDIIISFLRIKNKYDICNIHYPTLYSGILLPFIKSKTTTIIVSPWGSDVYRITNKDYKLVKRLYNAATYVTVPPIKFREDVQKKFSIPKSKFIDLGFGSEIINELIDSHSNNNAAKEKLGLNNKYIITCGYNASAAQNHLYIIKALTKIKNQLPYNALLLFPMTYVRNDITYINKVKHTLSNSGFEYIVYEEYLENSEILNIRLATDIFIHIQDTDAYSATIQEFLLTDTIVFNGAWTRYPNLETNGIPYLLVNNISDLDHDILGYLNKSRTCHISEDCKKTIKTLSWNNKGKEWYHFLKEYE